MTAFAALRRRWRNLPFAHKLGLLLIAIVSLPIVTVVSYTSSSSRSELVASARAQFYERAHGTAQVVDAFVAATQADVRTASRLASIVDLCLQPEAPGAHERVLRSLRAVRDEHRFLAVSVTDRSGRVLAASDERVALGAYQTGRAFLEAIAGETAVDEPAYEPADGRVALRVSHAVRSMTGEIIGTVTALVDLAAIDDLVQHDADFGGRGEFAILWTADGVRLSDSSDPSLRFMPMAPLPPDTLLVLRKRLGPAAPAGMTTDAGFAAVAERGGWLLYDPATDPHLRVESERAGALYGTLAPLHNGRWVYGIFVPETRLFAALRTEVLQDWAVAFFTVLAGLALTVIAARSVSQPLRRMTAAADALARGDMSRRVGLRQEDEFGELSEAFDGMADALAHKERQLQAHAAELERRVEERTRALQLFERASRTLSASLDMPRTAATFASLLVPSAADFCAIDARDGHGNLRRVAVRHADAARAPAVQALPVVRPARDAASTLTGDERERLGLTVCRVYELSAGRQFVGYLTVGMAGSDRPIDGDTERQFEEVGRRGGLALANALLYKEAQEANRLKDEFLGVVSHELRTPLNAIMGWTRLAGRAQEAGIDAQKALDAVDRNAHALARLVDDLLDVPRIMTGKLALDIGPVDLVAVVQGAADTVRPAAAARPITLDVRTEITAAPLRGDAHRLQQVFGNLLSNAVKFTPAGGSVVATVARAGETWEVSVEDTGVGIDADFLPFVFERFRQADSSTSRAHGGLGIGLSIVRHLVELHGGSVTAGSAGTGHGSRFVVRLPALEPDTAVVAPVGDVLGSVRPTARLSGLRLLVMDDDADARDVVSQMLGSLGVTVTDVDSVAAALETLGRAPSEFDAVLADIGMPSADGYAFIAGLRASPDLRLRTLPAVALTAYASRGDRQRALASGFDAHVTKPVNLDLLTASLSQVTAPATPGGSDDPLPGAPSLSAGPEAQPSLTPSN